MPGIYEKLIRPAMFSLDAETAHELGLASLRIGLGTASARRFAAERYQIDSMPLAERFGLKFEGPLGIAAGFDKNGVVVDQLAALGFGFVEVGTVTHRAQPGNDRPRLFRLPAEKALINRLGFNNDGAAAVAERLRQIGRDCIVGINIGKNRDVPIENATANYLAAFEVVHPAADYIAINISSPNTPNLRELQQSDNLDELLSSLQRRNAEISPKPLLVKIAPDLGESQIEAIVDSCRRHKIDGIIATNTTLDRTGISSEDSTRIGAGGLSGRPLRDKSNGVISTAFRYSKGSIPIIGVGGIFTGDDAFEKIAAGASLIQAYTGFVYGGPSFARDVNAGLGRILAERGFASLDEAVGSGI
ncbi:MAG: quinone-dependent dihydroorotate dehydrogenase [Pyrinomonadaceae bacterium]